MRIRFTPAVAAFAFLLPQAGVAAEGATRLLFASQDVVHLTIRAPVRRLAGSGPSSELAVDGAIVEDGAATPLPVKLSPRGISRRQHDVCSFPPIRVEFTAKPPATSLFHHQKKLKLVTHCEGQASFQQYLLLEYAAYRLYQVLTPQSFQVRLAKIDYVEPDGRPIISRLGFFIEDERDVARRNGLASVKTSSRIPLAALQPQAAARTAMFEYMIGNLDWSMTAGPVHTECCHNTKPMGPEGAAAGVVPVPHDFDMAGVVDPPYAVPPPGVTTASVLQREYRGYCAHNAEAEAAAADIRARRAALLAVFDQIPGLEERPRSKAVAYLDGFFGQIGDEASVARIVRNCLR